MQGREVSKSDPFPVRPACCAAKFLEDEKGRKGKYYPQVPSQK